MEELSLCDAKWGHAGFYIDCHRMTIPENILLQKKHCAQHYIAYSDNRNATLKLSLLKTVNSIQLQKATQYNYRSRTTGVGGSPRPSQLLKHTQTYDYRRW